MSTEAQSQAEKTQPQDITVETLREAPSRERVEALNELARAADDADGNPPFSEQTLIELTKALESDVGEAPLTIAYAWAGADTAAETEVRTDDAYRGLLAGAGVVVMSDPQDGQESPDVLEMVVRPDCRNQGIGGMLAAALSQGTLSPTTGRLQRAWAHGEHAAAQRLAMRFSWTPVRELWRMRLSAVDQMSSEDLPSAQLPEGVEIRPFRPGQDEQAWLRTNAAAFADHPEQGRLTLEDLQARMAEDWFDPAGFLLAWEKGADGEETLLGFHWTKVHHPEEGAEDHETVGEVYVVGVAPEAQGRGLGRSLTLAGIEHLHREGLSAIMLYVDADNEPAVGLYRTLGFTRWDVDTQFAPSYQ